MEHKLERKNSEYYLDDKLLTPEESQEYRNHSPDGFSHGYGGSGPAQLALAVMFKLKGNAFGYQEFKWKELAQLNQDEDFEIEFNL